MRLWIKVSQVWYSSFSDHELMVRCYNNMSLWSFPYEENKFILVIEEVSALYYICESLQAGVKLWVPAMKGLTMVYVRMLLLWSPFCTLSCLRNTLFTLNMYFLDISSSNNGRTGSTFMYQFKGGIKESFNLDRKNTNPQYTGKSVATAHRTPSSAVLRSGD